MGNDQLKNSMNKTWQRILISAVFCWMIIELIDLIIPVRHPLMLMAADLFRNSGRFPLILLCLILALSAAFLLYLSRRAIFAHPESVILFAYVIWLAITRLLLKIRHEGEALLNSEDLLLAIDSVIILAFFISGLTLESRQREKYLSALTIVFSGFFTVLCAIGIFTAVTKSFFYIYPKYDVWVGLTAKDGMSSLSILPESRLISVTRVYLAMALLTHVIITKKNALIRIMAAICILILYVAFMLFHSRTMLISLSVSCGMLAVILAFKPLTDKPMGLKIPLLFIIAAAAAILCYFSYGLINSSVSRISEHCAPRFAEWFDGLEHKPGLLIVDNQVPDSVGRNEYEDDDLTASVITDQRDISSNKTMSGRTMIWKSGLTAIKRDPSILLIGSSGDSIMDPVNKILAENGRNKVQPHMHNGFLQVLMLTGLPGLILIIAWTILMVIRMIRIFFRNDVSPAVKALIIPLAGIFIYQLAEVHVFSDSDILGKVFFLIAGVFLSYYSEDSISVIKKERAAHAQL